VSEIYAVDPKTPKNYDDLLLLVKTFGFAQGRFIASFPIDWGLILEENFQNIDGVDRLRVTKLIDWCIKDCLPLTGDYQYLRGSKTWLENALINQDRHRFFKLILSDKSVGNVCQEFHNALLDLNLNDDPRESFITSTIENYLTVIRPLLLVSTEVYLRDFNFYVDDPVTGRANHGIVNFLKKLFIEILRTKRCLKVTFILDGRVYKDEFSRDRLKKRFFDISDSVGAASIKIEHRFGVIRKKEHGRYFFSVKGGISFDSGFDSPPGGENHISWMTKKGLQHLLDMYDI